MSFVTTAQIQRCAETIDIACLPEDAARALATDVELRLREVIQVSEGAQQGSEATSRYTPTAIVWRLKPLSSKKCTFHTHNTCELTVL